VLTVLYSLPAFRSSVLLPPAPSSPSILPSLRTLFLYLRDSEDSRVSGLDFYSSLRPAGIRLSRQTTSEFDVTKPGDAREFYVQLLSSLLSPSSSPPSPAASLFVGSTTTSRRDAIELPKPNAATTTSSNFTFLSLPTESVECLQSAFDATYGVELEIVGSDLNGSPRLQQVDISTFPTYLAIHLHRPQKHEEPSSLSVPATFRSYSLVGALIHGARNSEDDGHVFAYVRHDGTRWARVSDEEVRARASPTRAEHKHVRPSTCRPQGGFGGSPLDNPRATRPASAAVERLLRTH
jgi:hypothetical protein